MTLYMTENNSHQYCLIMAGGVGSRLWPVSTKERPKQFLDLFGVGRTLLQLTYDRFAQFIDPSHIYISTHVDYLPLVYEQLPQVDDAHILEEPLRRGTLAAVAWGTVFITHQDPKATVVVSPADQMILNEVAFRNDIQHAMQFASHHESIVVMGVPPIRPETEYGYIQMADQPVDNDVYRVKSFTEKPALDFACMFVEDGSFLWNVGIFAFAASVMLDNICKLVPDYQQEIPKMMADAESADTKLLPEFFNVLPRQSIDLGVLERSDHVFVHRSQFGWADLGAWGTLHVNADENGNVLMDTEAILTNCKNNIIRLPQGRVAVVEGLTDYVVAEEGGVLFVCPRNRQDVRRVRTEAQMRLGLE